MNIHGTEYLALSHSTARASKRKFATMIGCDYSKQALNVQHNQGTPV
jgi:hypothetical protein